VRKIIAAINMTLDGVCDHTAGIADEEIHQHYSELLSNAGAIIWGRITYQLMESHWPTVAKNPTGNKATDDFAAIIDNIPKIVFSHTLDGVNWRNASVAKRSVEEEVSELRQQPGKDILVGSRSLIITLMNLQLVDEFQINVQPILAGKGLSLFENISDRINLKLLKTKIFSATGSMLLYYEPVKR
jgi:dihydrofolate reductase